MVKQERPVRITQEICQWELQTSANEIESLCKRLWVDIHRSIHAWQYAKQLLQLLCSTFPNISHKALANHSHPCLQQLKQVCSELLLNLIGKSSVLLIASDNYDGNTLRPRTFLSSVLRSGSPYMSHKPGHRDVT